jgi:hypothetical protein
VISKHHHSTQIVRIPAARVSKHITNPKHAGAYAEPVSGIRTTLPSAKPRETILSMSDLSTVVLESARFQKTRNS